MAFVNMITLLFEKIKEIDWQLYYLINQTLKNPFFDKWMPIITDIDNWMWILALGLIALFIFGGKKGKAACIILVAAVLIADNLNSYVLKPFFGRVRPNVIIGDFTGTPSPSFPSNHAVNVYTMAMVMTWYYKKFWTIWFSGACIVGYSRVYIGVHYPFDIAGGAVVGITCALCIIWLGNYIERMIRRFYVRYRNV